MSESRHKEMLKDALFQLTLLSEGITEPRDAKLFLDTLPDEVLPSAEDIEEARRAVQSPTIEEL